MNAVRLLSHHERDAGRSSRSRTTAYATSPARPDDVAVDPREVELDDLLSQPRQLNQRLAEVIDKHSDPWGVKVALVEVKHVDLPQEMQRGDRAPRPRPEREEAREIIRRGGRVPGGRSGCRRRCGDAEGAGHPAAPLSQTLTEIATEKTRLSSSRCRWNTIKMFLDMARDRK